MPDFKMIADFPMDNGPAISNVRAQFVQLGRKMQLFSDAVLAIDRRKFAAVNNRNRNFTEAKIKSRRDYLRLRWS